jgi:hypothetical protein
MNSLKDLLFKKAAQIDESGIKTDIQLVQTELDRYFNGELQLQKITKGVATVTTSNSSIASEMRMQQQQLIEDLASSLQNKIERFYIRIV